MFDSFYKTLKNRLGVLVLTVMVMLNINSTISVKAEEYPEINAQYGCVMDFESGRVLYEKNAYVQTPMASTTKIITAIIAIERGNLDDVITVSKNAADTWGSDIELKTGEKITLKALLYGLMLKSGNDAAVAIAEHISGSTEAFAELMTRKAHLIGATNTTFETPHGLDADNHKTTAFDLALIARYAMKNKLFRKIVSTKSANFPPRTFLNTNELLGSYPGTDGIKTGYTGMAGRCLVASATREDRTYIAVALGASNKTGRGSSCIKMLDYAFKNYTSFEIFKEDQGVLSIPIIKGLESEIVLVPENNSFSIPIKADNSEKVELQYENPDKINAPILSGVNVADCIIKINDDVVLNCPLKTFDNVERKSYSDFLKTIFESFTLLFG